VYIIFAAAERLGSLTCYTYIRPVFFHPGRADEEDQDLKNEAEDEIGNLRCTQNFAAGILAGHFGRQAQRRDGMKERNEAKLSWKECESRWQ